jgi:hypothetical protein
VTYVTVLKCDGSKGNTYHFEEFWSFCREAWPTSSQPHWDIEADLSAAELQIDSQLCGRTWEMTLPEFIRLVQTCYNRKFPDEPMVDGLVKPLSDMMNESWENQAGVNPENSTKRDQTRADHDELD